MEGSRRDAEVHELALRAAPGEVVVGDGRAHQRVPMLEDGMGRRKHRLERGARLCEPLERRSLVELKARASEPVLAKILRDRWEMSD